MLVQGAGECVCECTSVCVGETLCVFFNVIYVYMRSILFSYVEHFAQYFMFEKSFINKVKMCSKTKVQIFPFKVQHS